MKRAIEVAMSIAVPCEGYSSTPYLCPAGYWTQGYGTTIKPDGQRVTKDSPPCTKEQAYEWLSTTLESNLIDVLRSSPVLSSYPDALGAIVDFVYNLGIGRYRSSTLKRRIDLMDWEGAREELAKWTRGGGRVLPGLVKRREAEASYLR